MMLEEGRDASCNERGGEQRMEGGKTEGSFGFDVRFTIDVGGGDEAGALCGLIRGREEHHVARDVLVFVDLEDVSDLEVRREQRSYMNVAPFLFDPAVLGCTP